MYQCHCRRPKPPRWGLSTFRRPGLAVGSELGAGLTHGRGDLRAACDLLFSLPAAMKSGGTQLKLIMTLQNYGQALFKPMR